MRSAILWGILSWLNAGSIWCGLGETACLSESSRKGTRHGTNGNSSEKAEHFHSTGRATTGKQRISLSISASGCISMGRLYLILCKYCASGNSQRNPHTSFSSSCCLILRRLPLWVADASASDACLLLMCLEYWVGQWMWQNSLHVVR